MDYLSGRYHSHPDVNPNGMNGILSAARAFVHDGMSDAGRANEIWRELDVAGNRMVERRAVTAEFGELASPKDQIGIKADGNVWITKSDKLQDISFEDGGAAGGTRDRITRLIAIRMQRTVRHHDRQSSTFVAYHDGLHVQLRDSDEAETERLQQWVLRLSEEQLRRQLMEDAQMNGEVLTEDTIHHREAAVLWRSALLCCDAVRRSLGTAGSGSSITFTAESRWGGKPTLFTNVPGLVRSDIERLTLSKNRFTENRLIRYRSLLEDQLIAPLVASAREARESDHSSSQPRISVPQPV